MHLSTPWYERVTEWLGQVTTVALLSILHEVSRREDRKKAFIRLEGEAFGGVPLNIEVQLEVWDSPNSAGVVIDAIRYMKFFTDKKDLESLDLVSAWLMKAPAKTSKDTDTLHKLHELTHGEN